MNKSVAERVPLWQATNQMYVHFKALLSDLYDVRYSDQGGCPGCYQALYDYEEAAGIKS